MVGSINSSISTFSPSESIETTGPHEPSDATSPAPTGTGPYARPEDGFEVPPSNDNEIFADGGKTVVTCPDGEIAVVTAEGSTATVECKAPKGGKGGGGGKSPSGAPIIP